MPLVLQESFYYRGQTLVSDTQNAIVYLPNNHATKPLNVVLWLHGYRVGSKETLFGPSTAKEKTKLRESVDQSNKDVVLIAPFLGTGNVGDSKAYDAGINVLKKMGLETYLNEVLKELDQYSPQQQGFFSYDNKEADQSSPLATKTATQVFDSKKLPPEIDKLVIACHSAGGRVMRPLVATLGGKYESKLKECWGFESLYGSGDADFWYQWILKPPFDKCKLWMYYNEKDKYVYKDGKQVLGSKYIQSEALKNKSDNLGHLNVKASSLGHFEIVQTYFLERLNDFFA